MVLEDAEGEGEAWWWGRGLGLLRRVGHFVAGDLVVRNDMNNISERKAIVGMGIRKGDAKGRMHRLEGLLMGERVDSTRF